MTKTQTCAIFKSAGGATEKSANLGNGGKIFVLPFYEPRKSKHRVIRARHIGFSWLLFLQKKLPNDIIQSMGKKNPQVVKRKRATIAPAVGHSRLFKCKPKRRSCQ